MFFVWYFNIFIQHQHRCTYANSIYWFKIDNYSHKHLLVVRFQPAMLMMATVLESGALVGSIINPNLYNCIISVARQQPFLPVTSGKNFDYLIPVESELYLGLSWIIFSIIICFFDGGHHAGALMDECVLRNGVTASSWCMPSSLSGHGSGAMFGYPSGNAFW